MRKGLIATLLLVCSSSAASAQEATGSAQTPEWDMIEFETKGWGAPISSWRLIANGGSWTEAVREKNAPIGDYKLVWHDTETDAGFFQEISRTLLKLPVPAPDSADCDKFLPDMAYGKIRLTKAATTTEIAWNSGCMDEVYRSFISILKEADWAVAAKGREGPVLRVEESANR